MDNHLSQLKRPREAARREGASVRTPPAGAEVRVEHASRRYGSVDALVDASLHASPGEMLAITGRSGSGKSTLLHLIGGLDQPTSGRVLVDGREIWREPGSARHRRELVGFVFQQHFLLTDLVARANVEVALLGSGMRRTERRSRALELLDEVGLADRAEHLPEELSGGERQRAGQRATPAAGRRTNGGRRLGHLPADPRPACRTSRTTRYDACHRQLRRAGRHTRRPHADRDRRTRRRSGLTAAGPALRAGEALERRHPCHPPSGIDAAEHADRDTDQQAAAEPPGGDRG